MGYHQTPHTLDPNAEIPDDAPRSMGMDDDAADEVREHADALKEQVKAERDQPEVGPRAPGDHAEKAAKKTEAKKD